MKRKSRSKITNSPPANRPTRSTKATARRVRDLYTAFLARLGPGPHDQITEAGALRWAELTANLRAASITRAGRRGDRREQHHQT